MTTIRKIITGLIPITLLITFFYGSVFSTSAQAGQIDLSIDQPIDLTLFPVLSTFVSVFDPQGYLIKDASNFSAMIDAEAAPDINSSQTFEHPLEIVLVIDLSTTMSFGRSNSTLQNVINTTKDFIGKLGALDQVAVIGFSDLVFVAQDLTPDKQLVYSALDSLEAGGNSALNDAIIRAVDLLKSSAKRPLIIVLTDGVDSGISQASFEDAINSASQETIVVFPVGWGAANSEDLKQLADQTRGQLNYLPDRPPTIEVFQAAFSSISTSISEQRLQYKIDVTSALAKDGSNHELTILIDHIGRQAQASATFQAPPPEVLEISLDYQPNQEVGGNVVFAPRFYPEIPPVQRLKILINGQELKTISNPPFEYTWDSTSVTPGIYTFTLLAENSSVTSAQYEIPLKVVDPIVVKITNPNSGETLTGATHVRVDVTSLAPIAKVEFLLDNKSFGFDDQSPYEAQWNAQVSTPGLHELAVNALDVNGFSAQDQIKVNIGEISNGDGGWAVALVLAIGAGVLILILSLRKRKRSKKTVLSPAEAPASYQGPAPYSSSRLVSQMTLLELDGINPDRVWQLSQTTDVRLGRRHDLNEIPLKGGSASRQHAVIRYQQGEYIIQNLKLTHPILINEVPVTQQYSLQPGDTIRIGESHFKVQG